MHCEVDAPHGPALTTALMAAAAAGALGAVSFLVDPRKGAADVTATDGNYQIVFPSPAFVFLLSNATRPRAREGSLSLSLSLCE